MREDDIAEQALQAMDENTVRRILAAVDPQEVIHFEQSIVRIPSFTTEETPLASFIAEYMRGIGGDLAVELQEVPLSEGNVSHNVVGRLVGTGGGASLLLFGHLDHEPILGREFARLEGWKFDPFGGVIEGEWLYGKGSQDEKGGLTALVMAAKALVSAGVRLRGDVLFAAVQGHKQRSTGILYLLRKGLKADYAINTENCGNTIVPAFVGRSEGKIHIRAPELHFHTKDIFPEFRNRLTAFELLNQIQRALGPEMQPPGPDTWMTFEPHRDLPGYPQIRLEHIEFHGLDHLVLDFHVRTVPGMTPETIRKDLKSLLRRLKESYPYLDTQVVWPVWEHRSAMAVPHDHPLVQSLAHWHERVSGEPAQVSSSGMLGAAADASHTGATGIETILYGPGGGETDRDYRLKGHLKEGPPDERIALKDLVLTTKVLALTAADICG
jgi:acetylornithine deacetylase